MARQTIHRLQLAAVCTIACGATTRACFAQPLCAYAIRTVDIKGYLLVPNGTPCPELILSRSWAWASTAHPGCWLEEDCLDSDDNIDLGPTEAGAYCADYGCGLSDFNHVWSFAHQDCGNLYPFLAVHYALCSTLCPTCSEISSGAANAYAKLDLTGISGASTQIVVDLPTWPCSDIYTSFLGFVQRSVAIGSIAGTTSMPLAVLWNGECERGINTTSSGLCSYVGSTIASLGSGVIEFSSSPFSFKDADLDLTSDGRFNQLDIDGPSGLTSLLGSTTSDILRRFDIDHDGIISYADADFIQQLVDAHIDSGIFGDFNGDGILNWQDSCGVSLYGGGGTTLCSSSYVIQLDYNVDGRLDGTDEAAFAALNLPSPDFNGDGFVDFTDSDDFTDAYEDGLPSADFNRDGFLDFTDVDDFVSATTAGC